MKQNLRIIVFLGAALLSLLLFIRWIAPIGPVDKNGRSRPVFPDTKGAAIMALNDTNWDVLTRDEFKEIVAHFGNGSDRNSFEWNAKVALEQTVITDAYEGRSGEFFMSRLTPTLNKNGDSKAPIMVNVCTQGMDVSGNSRTLVNHNLRMFETGLNQLESGMAISTDEGVYNLKIKASRSQDENLFNFEASGGFKLRKSNHDEEDGD